MQDAIALELERHRQNQHEQNMQRFTKLEDGHAKLLDIQTAQSESLARIEENTKHLPDYDRRIDALEKAQERAMGGIGILGLLFAGWEFFIHLLKK